MRATCEDLWPHLNLVNAKFHEILPENWTNDVLGETTTAIMNTLSQELDRSSKDMYKIIQFYLRWGIARGGSGPSMHTTMALLGRDTSLQRLDELAAVMNSNSEKATTTDSR